MHNAVDKIWHQLRELLQRFDRTSVIYKAFELSENIIQDRDQWRRTAQAILSLYKPEEDVFLVAQDRESARANVSIAARTILEMAICECPEEGGRALSRWGLDDLLAKAALLIEVAADSDAISNDLAEPQIHLHRNGEYTIDRGFLDTIIRPFYTAYFHEEFEGMAKDYDELYKFKTLNERVPVRDVFGDDFVSAFYAEFDLTPDEAIDGFVGLMKLAAERDSIVLEATLGDLKSKLTSVCRFSPDVSKAFINTWSLFHRPEWDKPPYSFSNRDIYPWRFRRRLSLTARPIIIFGNKDSDKAIFGISTLQLGIMYLLDRSARGHLPQEFFTSEEMKKYIGAVNNKMGHAFAQSVAEKTARCWMAGTRCSADD